MAASSSTAGPAGTTSSISGNGGVPGERSAGWSNPGGGRLRVPGGKKARQSASRLLRALVGGKPGRRGVPDTSSTIHVLDLASGSAPPDRPAGGAGGDLLGLALELRCR